VHQFLSQYFPTRNFERFKNSILEGLNELSNLSESGILEPTKLIMERLRLIEAWKSDELSFLHTLEIDLTDIEKIQSIIGLFFVQIYNLYLNCIKLRKSFEYFLFWMSIAIKSMHLFHFLEAFSLNFSIQS
jgi:hypothetical protein